MLPDDVRLLHFEEELDDFRRRLIIEKKKANVARDMSILLDLKDVGDSIALRSTRQSKASTASTSRHSSSHRGEPRIPRQW
jgi:hypothetical protein